MKVATLTNDTRINFFARQRALKYAVFYRNKSTNKRLVYTNITVSPTNGGNGTNSDYFFFEGQHKTDLEVSEGQMVDFAIYASDNVTDFLDFRLITPIYLGTAFMTDQEINQNYNLTYSQNKDAGVNIYKQRETENEYIIYE